MSENDELQNVEPDVTDALPSAISGSKRRRAGRFVATALGSLPWVGGVWSAAAARDAELEQGEVNELIQVWLEEHQSKILELQKTIETILGRLQELEAKGAEIRIEEDAYLEIVRKGFRTWDQADTDEKRDMIRRLLTNAGCSELCQDDVIRLFLDWMRRYHEVHFAVIRAIYRNPGITRANIWAEIRGDFPREDSAEADLFKMLIRDLSTGSVIRQHRETNYYGEFIKKKRSKRRSGSNVRTSAFDDAEPYELTQLGSQFVHYTLQDPAPRLP